MRNMLQIVGGVAAAGVIAAGATAMTGGGLTRHATDAADIWVGGKVTQSVTGAVVTDIDYTYTADVSKTQITAIDLDFTGATSKTILVKPAGGAFDQPGAADEWVCGGNAEVLTSAFNSGTGVITVTTDSAFATMTCSTADSGNAHGAAGYYQGISSLEITVQ
ncbi:hypothetical protein ACQP2X_44910 [Actinoplanes sp. CA-131856]